MKIETASVQAQQSNIALSFKQHAETDRRINALVVLSSLLVNLGAAIAIGSFYIVTVMNPLVLVSSPVLIALGVWIKDSSVEAQKPDLDQPKASEPKPPPKPLDIPRPLPAPPVAEPTPSEANPSTNIEPPVVTTGVVSKIFSFFSEASGFFQTRAENTIEKDADQEVPVEGATETHTHDIPVAVKREYTIQRLPNDTLPLGLYNPSCNCWINATFNALMACDDLRSRILATFDAGDEKLQTKMAPLVEAIRAYESDLANRPGNNLSSVDTQKLREWVHNCQPIMSQLLSPVSKSCSIQEDAMVFFEMLQNYVFMNYLITSKTENKLPSGVNIVSESSPVQSSTHISFELEDKKELSFDELLYRYFNTFDPKADFGYNPETKKPFVAEMQQTKRLVEAPTHLMIQAKRFFARVKRDSNGEPIQKRDGSVAMEKGKISHDINFPMDLTLDEKYCSSTPSYRLKSFIHQGGSLSGGHYKSYVRYGKQWFCTNDETVTQVSTDELPLSQAYITFYEKIESPPTAAGG